MCFCCLPLEPLPSHSLQRVPSHSFLWFPSPRLSTFYAHAFCPCSCLRYASRSNLGSMGSDITVSRALSAYLEPCPQSRQTAKAIGTSPKRLHCKRDSPLPEKISSRSFPTSFLGVKPTVPTFSLAILWRRLLRPLGLGLVYEFGFALIFVLGVLLLFPARDLRLVREAVEDAED